MKSYDEIARDEAHFIADTIPDSFWRQRGVDWLAQGDSRPSGSFRDKEEFIEKYIVGRRLHRDTNRSAVARAYKAVDPASQFDQLVTLSFDKAEFRPEMIEQLVRSLRQKCPKVIDYERAILRPEFNAIDSTDPSFNPHVHIYTPKLVKESAVTNAFVKRFVSCKKKLFPIYNVNVVTRLHPAHANYIRGDKSTPEKIEKIDKDRIYRESQTPPIAEIYPIDKMT